MIASGIASAAPPANPLVEVLARSPSLTGLKGKLEALLACGMLGQQRFFVWLFRAESSVLSPTESQQSRLIRSYRSLLGHGLFPVQRSNLWFLR